MTFNVLLIDDEAGIVQALARVLNAEGIRSFTAHNMQDAIEILQQHTIKVMISDFRMPGGDGLELCRQARQCSPGTYRLLLSGHVEYPLLRSALQQGEAHKFVAKPWNNSALISDVIEGSRQSDLMFKVHSLKAAVHADQPAFITDRNWIIRLANQKLCSVLGIAEEHLVGRNLFAPSLCAMPVIQEAEITRQTEANQTWLGYFSLINAQRRQIPTWMAVSSLSHDYRICACSFVTEDASTGTEIRTELRRYSGTHQLDEFCHYIENNYGQARTLLVEFPAEMVNDADLSALCYERISVATGGLQRVFTPAPHIFLIPLAASQVDIHPATLSDNIRRQFSAPLIHRRQILQVSPMICEESTSGNGEQPFAALRHRLAALAIQSAPETRNKREEPETPSIPLVIEKSDTDPNVLPVFDRQGRIIGLQSPPAVSEPHDWIDNAGLVWRRFFTSRPVLLLDPGHLQGADIIQWLGLSNTPSAASSSSDSSPGTQSNARTRTTVEDKRLLMLDCERGLPQHIQLLPTELQQSGCSLLLHNPSLALSGSKQLATLPVAAIGFDAISLQQLQGSESAFRRQLQKWRDSGIPVYAEKLATTADIAMARQWDIDWLSGTALSRMINGAQLGWFGGEENDPDINR
jgi:CheY-like chemotaxis protein